MSDPIEKPWAVVDREGDAEEFTSPTRDEAQSTADLLNDSNVRFKPYRVLRLVDPDATAEPHDCRCPSRYRFDTGAIVRCTQWAGHHDSDGPYDTPHNWEGRRWTDDEAYVAPPSVKEKVLAVLNRESVSEVTFRKELARRIAAAIEDGDDG